MRAFFFFVILRTQETIINWVKYLIIYAIVKRFVNKIRFICAWRPQQQRRFPILFSDGRMAELRHRDERTPLKKKGLIKLKHFKLIKIILIYFYITFQVPGSFI